MNCFFVKIRYSSQLGGVMPLVEVNIHKGLTTFVDKITKILPSVVAEALIGDEAGSKLVPSDIEVRVRVQGICDPIVEGSLAPKYDIGITIFAHDFPSRKVNLDFRRKMIASAVNPIVSELPDFKGYVWILLCPGAFGEI